MSPSGLVDRLAPVIEELIEEKDPSLRGRRFLRALVEQGLARGAELWQSSSGTWSRIATFGSDPSLPTHDQVEAVAQGQLDGTFPPDTQVIVIGLGSEASALGITGLPPDEELRDLIEATLVLHSSLSEAAQEEGAGGLADMLLAPFGLGSDDSPTPHVPSAETASLFALLEEAQETPDDEEN